jgi:hypothetical protein
MSKLNPGWLERQFKIAADDVKEWPEWMRREAGLDESKEDSSNPLHMQGVDHESIDR